MTNQSVTIDDAEANWRKQFDEALRNPPKEGDFLSTRTGELIKVEIDCQPGKPPFVFARLYLHQIVGEPVKWFVVGLSEEELSGWKCILMPKSKMDLIRKKGMTNRFVGVPLLKVVRSTDSAKAYLVETVEDA